VDGVEAVIEGDQVGYVYRYDRTKAEVLALMGKACLRASRSAVASGVAA
jgi:hypothetical protein